jgi:hypothetical protein
MSAKTPLSFSSDIAIAGRRIFKGGFLISCLPQGYEDETSIKDLVQNVLLLGCVSGIKIVNKTSDRGAQFQSAYVDMLYWSNTYSALLVQSQLSAAMRTNDGVTITHMFSYDGCESTNELETGPSACELEGSRFELSGVPRNKLELKFKNGKPMTHLTLRPTKIGMTCDGSTLDVGWSSLYIPILPKNMTDFATFHAEGEMEKRNAILDDILYALFENYQCVGKVSRIDYCDVLAEDQGPTGNLRAFIHFHEWWNTANTLAIRNSVEANAKQWQIRGHIDQYENEYSYIVVKRNEKPVAAVVSPLENEAEKFRAMVMAPSQRVPSPSMDSME